ncbi:hypothetical protein PO909_029048 [Leuciscus waleckii]
MAVHQRLPSNLTELERICKEEWQRIPKSRHFLQLFREDTEAFPSQPGDIIPPACPRSSLGSGTPPREGVQEASGTDARAPSAGSSRCGGAAALL